MRKLVCAMFAVVVCFSAAGSGYAMDLKVKAPEGTEWRASGLTDKQLAIQRWFSSLTFMNMSGDVWAGWYHDKSQLGLDSYRYSLAFLGYAAGASAYKTPAYTEVSAKIVDNAIQRLIRKEVWDYISHYWKKRETYPDPVAYENIMYSGHLMQLIALYESLTGDMKYSTKGWDFVWDEKTVIHYDAEKLMQVVYQQVLDDERGGVPCEPNTIFIICNDHPHVAFHLYDAMHETNFSKSGDKWRAWMELEGLLPPQKGRDYFKISYLRDRKMWTTGFGVPGADGWALAWMYPWNKNADFVCKGWRTMYNNRLWSKGKDGGLFIRADAVAGVFGVNDSSGTSFYPAVERQCLRGGEAPKADGVFEHFERKFGAFADTDGDGAADSYYYDTDERTRIWATANLFLGMLVKGDSLREMYNVPFYKEHEGEPYLEHAAYPDVLVREAEYSKDTKRLHVSLARGRAGGGETELVFANAGSVKAVSVNGSEIPAGKYVLKDGKLTLRVDAADGTAVDVEMK